jgi:hypothetical protein
MSLNCGAPFPSGTKNFSILKCTRVALLPPQDVVAAPAAHELLPGAGRGPPLAGPGDLVICPPPLEQHPDLIAYAVAEPGRRLGRRERHSANLIVHPHVDAAQQIPRIDRLALDENHVRASPHPLVVARPRDDKQRRIGDLRAGAICE